MSPKVPSTDKGKKKATDDPSPAQKQRKRPGRVPVSCAECRRLKLRCDRKVPCETCSKRGCATICPTGTLATGPTKNRYILANTEELHSQIDALTIRVRELEHGLSLLQATVSNEPHPLLENRTSSVGSTPKDVAEESAEGNVDHEEVVEAFGTLNINAEGDSTFLGATARSDYLLKISRPPEKMSYLSQSELDPRVLDVPFPECEDDWDNEAVKALVWSHLPPLSEAFALAEVFIECSLYFPTSMTRTQLFDGLIPELYQSTSIGSEESSHSLGLFFMILCLGKYYDMSATNHLIAAHDYFSLSRAALIVKPFVRRATVTAIQAMTFMGQYLEMSDAGLFPGGSSRSWMYIGLASKLAQSMGLHRDCTPWGIGLEETQRRSRCFWHLYTLDAWNSFGFGRPPTFNPAFVNCPLPEDLEQYVNPDGSKSMGWYNWCYLFTQALHAVMIKAFGARPPQYRTILDLDRMMRDIDIPDYLRSEPTQSHGSPTKLVVRRWIILSNTEWTLLNLHRPYFAVAIRDHTVDPAQHKFSPSVLAIYRAANRIIEAGATAVGAIPQSFFRFSFGWSKVLSSAIVMCLLVTNAPSSSLAVGALERLDFALSFFEHSVLVGSHPAADCLNAMRSLHRQGHEAMDKYRSPNGTENATGSNSNNLEDLARLGAMTQRLSSHSSIMAAPAASMDSSHSSVPPSHPVSTPSPPNVATVLQPASASSKPPPPPPPPTVFSIDTAPKYDFTPITPFGRHRMSTSSTSATLPNPTSSSLYNIFDYTSSDSRGNGQFGPQAQVQDIASVHRGLAKIAPSSSGGFSAAEFMEPSSMFVGTQGLDQYPPSSTSRDQSDSPSANSVTAQAPYILDASWQDFVEQLGF